MNSCDGCAFSAYSKESLQKNELRLICLKNLEDVLPCDTCKDFVPISEAIHHEGTFENIVKLEQQEVRKLTWGDNPFAYSTTESLTGALDRYSKALFKSVMPKITDEYEHEMNVEAWKVRATNMSADEYSMHMLTVDGDRLAEKLISFSAAIFRQA